METQYMTTRKRRHAGHSILGGERGTEVLVSTRKGERERDTGSDHSHM